MNMHKHSIAAAFRSPQPESLWPAATDILLSCTAQESMVLPTTPTAAVHHSTPYRPSTQRLQPKQLASVHLIPALQQPKKAAV